MNTFDEKLFMCLNFDGGPFLDRLMLVISGTTMWLPLYALIAWLVWRRGGWRNLLIFIVLMAAAVGLADLVAGIFKHSGPLKDLLPNFEPRPRPMFTAELEGLCVAPDSVRALRWAEPARDWAVHVPPKAIAGLYGTVSAHASTIVALAVLSASVIRRRWFSWLMVVASVVICYSRIYLAKHYPMDLVWGTLEGLLLGWGAVWIYRRFERPNRQSTERS